MAQQDEARMALRASVYRGDGPGVLAALGAPALDDVAQLAGDGLLAALAQQVPRAPELAELCAARLRARGWRGDDDLAEQLEAALGQGPSPLLRLLPVDLDELADLLEGDPADGGGRVDLRSGEVWPQAAVDYAREVGEEDPDDEEDPDRWLAVWCEGSREGYRDMQDFLGTVTDPGRADRLSIAMSGRGAFRRFKDVLARWPAELERWHGFAEERQRGRARAWLALVGYAPVRSRPLRG